MHLLPTAASPAHHCHLLSYNSRRQSHQEHVVEFPGRGRGGGAPDGKSVLNYRKICTPLVYTLQKKTKYFEVHDNTVLVNQPQASVIPRWWREAADFAALWLRHSCLARVYFVPRVHGCAPKFNEQSGFEYKQTTQHTRMHGCICIKPLTHFRTIRPRPLPPPAPLPIQPDPYPNPHER